MATLKKLDSGVYEVRYDYVGPDTGVRKQPKRRFDRHADARAFKIEIEKATKDGGYVEVKARPFSEWIDEWFEVYKVTSQLELTTIASYERIIKRLKSHFGVTHVNRIRPKDVENLIARMMNPASMKDYEAKRKLKPLTDKPLSSSTAQRHYAVLHRAFKFAVRDDIASANPCDKIDPPGSAPPQVEAPSVEAINTMLDALRESDLYLAICIALLIGPRQSEILGLRWSRINFETRKLSIRCVRMRISKKQRTSFVQDKQIRILTIPGMEGWYERDRTKNKHLREMIMPPELIELLNAAKLQQKKNKLRFGSAYMDSDYVCVHDDGRPLGDSELSHAIKPFGFRFHDLRHANATYLTDAGVPFTETARRLGHTTPTTTIKFYAHTVNKQDEEAAMKIGRNFTF